LIDGVARPREGITVGYVPQEPRLEEGKTVRENVELAVAPIRALLLKQEQLSEQLGRDLSPDAMEKEWPALIREMSAVHGRIASLVAEAPEDTPIQARAPVVMVINGMEWIEELDWKAHAMAFRAHSLGHAGQIRAILEELGEKKEERPEENSRS